MQQHARYVGTNFINSGLPVVERVRMRKQVTVLNWTSPMLFAGIGGELMQ